MMSTAQSGTVPAFPDTPAIEARGLTRSYGSVVALDSVDLTVGQGELVSLLGASGSGKSTLLRLIAGFDTPTGGGVWLHGQEVTGSSPAERDIGMVFQNYALFPHMTVSKNIAYGLRRRGMSGASVRERVAEMVERMKLDGLADRYPEELSGGQQQRVAIARALSYKPRVLLMDEPLGALDRRLKESLLAEIRRVHREFSTTIIYVTHDKEEALILSDRIALMDEGRVRACDTVANLYLHPSNEFVARFISNANILPVGAESSAFRVVSSGPDSISVEADGGMVHTLERGSARDADAGDFESSVRIAVRPEVLRLQSDPEPGMLSFQGTVGDTFFLGDLIEVSLETEHPGWPEPVLARVPRESAMGVARGDRVRLGFDPALASVV